MTIKVGTIQEMTGQGYEILVDAETRSEVLARFFDGHFILGAEAMSPDQASEATRVPSAN